MRRGILLTFYKVNSFSENFLPHLLTQPVTIPAQMEWLQAPLLLLSVSQVHIGTNHSRSVSDITLWAS